MFLVINFVSGLQAFYFCLIRKTLKVKLVRLVSSNPLIVTDTHCVIYTFIHYDTAQIKHIALIIF